MHLLQDSTIDLVQNRNSVVVQLLVALVGFSSYYQEHALIELGNFYASKKLVEGGIFFFY